jgi:hypothetical protein
MLPPLSRLMLVDGAYGEQLAATLVRDEISALVFGDARIRH